jgi:hypothetical protein
MLIFVIDDLQENEAQGYLEIAWHYWNIMWEYTAENPVLVGSSAFVGALPVLICFFFASKSTPRVETVEDEIQAEEVVGEEESTPLVAEEEGEEESTPLVEEEVKTVKEEKKPAKHDSPVRERKQKQKQVEKQPAEQEEDSGKKKAGSAKKRTPRAD